MFAACDTMDHLMLLAQLVHELEFGCCSHAEARRLREDGDWKIPTALFVDAMSVFGAVTATFVKEPAEKSLWSHVKYLWELLDNRVLSSLVWLDTRDMASDGLTKGSVDRTLIHLIMSGLIVFKHAAQCWSAKVSSLK